MEITLKEISQFIGGKITGDETLEISNLSRIEEAKENDLTFLYHPSYEKFFPETKASAILVKPDFKKTRDDIAYIEIDKPEDAFAELIINFFSMEVLLDGIDETAYIHKNAEIGENVALGKNVVISAGCKIGNNVKMFHNTVLLENIEIGNDCILYQNVNIREDSIIGNRVIIHAGSVIGSDGFGFNPDEKGRYRKVPQIGNVIIGDDVEIGANACVDRAALGSTIIGRGTKIDNLVQIAHNCEIGEDTVISGQAGVAGSSRVGDNCMLAGQVGIASHLNLGNKVVLLAQSGVTKSLKPGYYFGTPAKELKTAHKLEAHVRRLPEYSDRIRVLEKEINQLKEQLSKKR
jgi:UDP-3-O-[3-hydroxymyristoyl] glucosamine N-acyltransferase